MEFSFQVNLDAIDCYNFSYGTTAVSATELRQGEFSEEFELWTFCLSHSEQIPTILTPGSLVAYGSGKRMVTGTRAGSRIKTRNFIRRFLPHHKSQRRDIWRTSGPVVSCFNPKFVDRSVPYEATQRRVKFRRCFGNIPSEFR